MNLQEIHQCRLCFLNVFFLEGILIRQIHHLQQPCVSKSFFRSREFCDPVIVGRLHHEHDMQPGGLRLNLHLDLFKDAGALQCLNRVLNFLVGVRLARLLRHQTPDILNIN